MSDPPAPTVPPSNKPPRGRLRRWLGRFALVGSQVVLFTVLGLISLFVGWLHSEDFERRAISFTEGLIVQATGESCTIAELEVSVWPPAIEAHDLHIEHPPSGDSIVRAKRIRAPLVLRDGGIKLGRVILDSPSVALHLDASGQLREFANAPRPPPDQRKPLRELPWSSIQLLDGSFHLSHPEGQITLTDLNLEPLQGPITDLTGQLRIQARDLDETLPIDLPSVVLGPRKIEIPNLEIRGRPLVLTGRAIVPFDGELDVDLSAHVPLEEINPLLTPPRKAHGQAYADLRIEGRPADPVLRATALIDRFGLDLPGVFTPLLTYEFGHLTTAIVATREGIEVENLTANIAGGTLTTWGRITPDKRLRDGRVIVEGVRLRELLMAFDAAPTPWVDMSTDLEISWSGTVAPLHLEGHFDMDVGDLLVGNAPIGSPGMDRMLDIDHAYAKGTVLLEKDHIFLAAHTVRAPRTRASAVIDIGFGPRGPLDLQVDITGADLREFQPLNGVGLTGRGRITGKIHGPFNALQMRGQGDVTGFSVMGIPYADHLVTTLVSPDMKSIELVDARARKGVTDYGGYFKFDFKPPMGMYTDITFEEGRIEDAVGIFIDLPGMTGNLSGTLDLAGDLFDLDGESHLSFTDVDLWGERFEYGEAHGYMDQGLFTLDDLRVLRHDDQEGLVLRGSVERDWALDMELFGDGLALERLSRLEPKGLPLTGDVAFHTSITNTLFDPSPSGRISVSDVQYDGFPIEDSQLVFSSEDGIATYAAVLFGGTATVDGTLGLWGEQPYSMAIDLQDLPVHALYPEGANGNPIRAITSGRMSVAGHFGPTWSPVTLRAALDPIEIRYGHHVLRNPGAWHFAMDGNSYRLSNFTLVGGVTDFELSAESGDTLLLGGEGRVDLDLLRAVVPGLERSVGTAQVTLYAVGAKPDVQAVIEVDVDAEILRHSSVPAAFEDLTAHARVTDRRIDLTSVKAGLGGGRFTGKGHIDAEGWMPRRWTLGADVRDAQIQWVDSLPPAIGDATLRFDGPVDALLLSGRVDVSDMTFSDRIDWEDWVVEYRNEMLVDTASLYHDDDASYFDMNIEIHADRTIRLRNNVGEGTASADLRIIGDTDRPGLLGNVRIDDGIAFLQDREFVIDRGDMLFNDPWTWDPQLDFDLVTDIDNRDQRYRVNYLVMGPFSNWRTQTRSDPPMPQSDVNALLWFGMTTEELEEMGELSSAVAQGVADLVITDFFLTNAQAGDLGSGTDLLFDRLDLATGVNARGEYSSEPRLVVQRRIDEFGDIELTGEFNLVRPDDIYLSVERRIGGVWSLAGWYATLQRERVLPIGGAYGMDITARWESD